LHTITHILFYFKKNKVSFHLLDPGIYFKHLKAQYLISWNVGIGVSLSDAYQTLCCDSMLDSLQIKLVMDELKFQRRFLSGLQSETLVLKNVFGFFYSMICSFYYIYFPPDVTKHANTQNMYFSVSRSFLNYT
jgi:hypothetical protein